MDITYSNKSINNIELPKEYTMKENVMMNKEIYNTNVKPRYKVQYGRRRRSSKDIIFNELNKGYIYESFIIFIIFYVVYD